MRIFSTLPGNTDFFHRYAGIIPTLHRSGYLAQVISFLTEIGIIYSIVYQSVANFFPARAEVLAYAGALIGAGFLEVGLRKFLPFGVRQILYRRYRGLDRIMTLFILSGATLLLLTSGVLSFRGSRDLVDWAAPTPVLETTVAADSLADEHRQDARARYRRDSLAVAERYAARLAVEATRLEGYEAREARTGLSYATRKQSIRERMAGLREEQAAALAQVWENHATQLAAIDQARDSTATVITLANDQLVADSRRKIATYGGSLGWFTVICLLVLVISVVLHEVYRKGSAIEETAQPGQYTFAPAVWREAWDALAERGHYLLRSRITAFADGTPAPPLPAAVKPLYDQSALATPSVQVKVAQTEEETIELPVRSAGSRPPEEAPSASPAELARQALDYTAAVHLEAANLPEQAAEMHLKAEQVLAMYLGPGATDEQVRDLRKACLDHLHGDGPNPFGHFHRRPIGFAPVAGNGGRYNGPVSTTETVIDGSLKNCRYCGQTYRPKAHNQKYCSPECKQQYHAERHGGQPFLPYKFHGKRK